MLNRLSPIGRTRSIVWLLATLATAYGLSTLADAQEPAAEAAEATAAVAEADSPELTAPTQPAGAPEADAESAAPADGDTSEATPAADDNPSDAETSESDAEISDADFAAEVAAAEGAEVSAAEGADAEADAEKPTEDSAAAAADAPSTDGATAAEGAEAAAGGGGSLLGLLSVLAALVLPILAGNSLAKLWRMPEQAWRLCVVLGSMAIAGLFVATKEFKGGPDLAGGITLVYELADAAGATPAEGGDTDTSADEPAADGRRGKVDVERLVQALAQRVDPTGTKEVSIRNYGGAVEIIIPKAGPDDLEFIKRRITDLGQLEFRITADPRWTEDRPIIEKARQLGPSEKLVVIGDKPRAEWVAYDERQFSEEDSRLVQRTAGSRKEALVLLDRWNVTGEYLANAAKSYGDVGQPIVLFNFDSRGAARFGKFTGANLENPATGAKRFLGILLDKRLISAPSLNDRITGSGQIEVGGDEAEVDYIVSILNAGSLPAALNKTPISEEQISPTLGVETIQRATFALALSMVVVPVFMLFYYRFSGFVACLALVGMLLLVLASMVAIDAAFTLPGLAGLVLTVGMAVDANVLIFERMREEIAKGAGLRMAIRNGFGKAFTAIFDSNVTTLIAAAILYSVGTGPVKGFGVTMFLGIVMSMFTAVFCSRVVFEVAERRGWIKSLSFVELVGKTNFDFLGKSKAAIALSLVVIGVGLAATFSRGSGLLDIDFTGGSSVTVALDPDAKSSFAEVNEAVGATELAGKNLTVVESGNSGTRFTVTSSVDDVERVQEVLEGAFGDKLQTYQVSVGTPEAFTEAGGSTGTLLPLEFNKGSEFGAEDGLAHDALVDRLKSILADLGARGVEPAVENPDYTEGSSKRFKDWTLRLGGLDSDKATEVAERLKSDLGGEALFPLSSKIGGRVAGDMQVKAISAIVLSLLGTLAYLWFRFQNVAYGVAAIIALIHDVLVTLGALAVSSWIVNGVPPVASLLQIDSFQIGLTMLAAFITIIGYSLNDTIVIFDRVREVKGKSSRLTAETINKSINQTLSRTFLTAFTTLLTVVILYFVGGPGIHGFAYAMVVGVVVGTYSTVFIATPALLWMAGVDDDGASQSSGSRRAAA